VESAYPHVRVEGGPRERGRQYGEQARDRVRVSIDAYREVFGELAGWDAARVAEEARRFQQPIAAFGQAYAEELRGISEGAAVGHDDVLAINVRTEIMFAAKARQAREAVARPGECSAFAVLPDASIGGTLVGQNWDWLPHAFDTVVVLEATRDDGPDYVTVVEAGLLAKTSLTSSGLGVVTNALATEHDVGEPGVPYHVLLRALLDAETIAEALGTLQRARRSSSAGYGLAHEDGLAVYVEAEPGDFSRLHLVQPVDGVLLHTNHFLAPTFRSRDVSLWAIPDSPFRLERLRTLVEWAEHPLSDVVFREVLADHAGHPFGICCHPDTRAPMHDQGGTVACVVMDLDRRRVWLSDGPPCEASFRELDYGPFLSKPSPLRPGRRLHAV
jgi:isopenicillin-N N-acyltransferase-like protein